MPPPLDAAAAHTATAAYLQRLITSPPCSANGFTSRRPAVRIYKNVGMCRPCLTVWAKSSDDVETYNYNNDPNSNVQKYSIEVKCPQCKTKITRRSINHLLGNRGRGSSSAVVSASGRGSGGGGGGGGNNTGNNNQDEWEESIRSTIEAVSWGEKVKKWAKKELLSRDDVPSDLVSAEEKELRDALISAVQESDSADGLSHRQEIEKGEVLKELMAKCPKFRQEVEDGEAARAYNEQIKREEEEERQRLEADERMARDLEEEEKRRSKEKSSTETSSSIHVGRDRDKEDEKRSEEYARALQEEILKQEEEEKRRREERDGEFAKELQAREEREQRKRKASSLSPGGSKRKSPFDSTCSSRVATRHDNGQVDGGQKEVDGDEKKREPIRGDSKTSKSVPKNSGATYVIDNSDTENDGESDAQLLTQTMPSPQSRQPLSHTSSTASTAAAGSATATAVAEAPSMPSISCDGKGAITGANDEKESWGDANEEDIDRLESMGFDREEAKQRYIDACRDVEGAANMLFSALEERQRTEEERTKCSQRS